MTLKDSVYHSGECELLIAYHVRAVSFGLDLMDSDLILNLLNQLLDIKMDPTTYESVTDKSLWKRILVMLVLGFAFGIAKFVLFATVVLQILFTLFTGSNNVPLKTTGKTLTKYIYEIFTFLTFNSEEKPFPFKAWS